MEKISINEGNRSIAKFLGFEYVPSNSDKHEKPNGFNIGYWKHYIDGKNPIEQLAKLAEDGFKPVMYRAKLPFDTEWESLMKVVSKIERLTDFEASFEIHKENCVVVVRDVVTKQLLSSHVAVYKKTTYAKLAGVWECVVLFCDFYNSYQSTLSNTR